MKYTYFLILLFLFSCEEQNPKVEFLSDAQLYKLEDFAEHFEQQVLDKDYEIFNQYWSDEELKKRIGPLSKTGQTVFNHYFKKEWASDVKLANMNLINNIKYNYGTIRLTKTESFDQHLDATYTISIDTSRIEFIKYRFEIRDSKPIITDRCNVKDNTWLSQRIRHIINTGVKYPVTSKQRQNAGRNMQQAETSIRQFDYVEALEYLNSIPIDFSNNLNVSIMKLESANEIDFETYSNTLKNELNSNGFEYLKYLNEVFIGDSISYQNYFTHLAEEVGDSYMIDSLFTMKYIW